MTMRKNILQRLVLTMAVAAGSFSLYAQQVSVTGKVTDATGDPLVGVSVTVPGTAVGTVTNADGNYGITVDSKATMRFYYIGYQAVDEKVAGRSVINVTMQEDTKMLDEVVVIGYGTMDKKELTSAIAHVSEKDFLSVSSADPIMMIQGKVPGLSITNTGSSDPNNMASIQLRGVSSREAGNNPLIVIDGVPGGDLANVNPQDIASFDVLKDGAASAIYGTRGSNGVILITTKSGSKDGRTHTTYSGTVTWDKLIRPLDFLDAQEYRDLRLANGDIGQDVGDSVDWFDAVSRTGFSTKHSLSVSGGNAQSNYRVSVDYKKANGTDLRATREEYGARASINHTTKGGLFNINVNIAPRKVSSDNSDWSVFRRALETNPTIPIMDPENPMRYYNFSNQSNAGVNSVEKLRLEETKTERTYIDWNATLKLNLLPVLAKDVKNQTLSTQVMFANQTNNHNDRWFRPSTSTLSLNSGTQGSANQSWSKNRQDVFEWLANYSAKFADAHNLKVMLGYSYHYQQYQYIKASNANFPNDGLGSNALHLGAQANEEGFTNFQTNKNDSKLISFFGRVSYDYKGKYLFTASLRHEGSSRFGANHKWGNFPAVSAGWRISEESFMKDLTWLDDLKIRGDYGVTGNQDFGNYKSLNTMCGYGYIFVDGDPLQVYGPAKNVNPDLKWEKGKNWNIGIDFSVMNNLISGSLNYYHRKQEDLLGNYTVPTPPFLFTSSFVNVGTMRNTGFEFDLTFNPVQTRDFDYSFSVLGATMDNKFLSFSNSQYVASDYYDVLRSEAPYDGQYMQRVQAGERLGNFYLYKYAGIDREGNWLIYDREGDIVRADQRTDEDRQIVGNGMPKFTMSTTHNFRYKNFDLSLFFRGAFGYDIFNIHDFYYGNRGYNGNVIKKAYTKNYAINPNANPVATDYFLERGDYFKLDKITLGYTLPLHQARFADSIRIYGTVNNVFTITKFSGVDPDCYQVNGLTPSGTGSREFYPTSRQFILGVQLDF